MAMKTNAMRQLDQLHLPYDALSYVVDPADLQAESVARKLGLSPGQLFKTLVVRGDRVGVMLAVIAGDMELDLKALAQASGNRKIEVVPLKEVQPLTGYIRGGVTALACKKKYPVYLDTAAVALAKISISAGVRGTQILLQPAHYMQAVDAVCVPIARPKTTP